MGGALKTVRPQSQHRQSVPTLEGTGDQQLTQTLPWCKGGNRSREGRHAAAATQPV